MKSDTSHLSIYYILWCVCAVKSSAFITPISQNHRFSSSPKALRISNTNRDDGDVVLAERKSYDKDRMVTTEQPGPPLMEQPPPSASITLSKPQIAQTLAYRAALFGITVVYGIQLILPVLQDAGLSIGDETTTGILSLHLITVASTTAACALTPKTMQQGNTSNENNSSNNKMPILVDANVFAASVASALSGEPLFGLAALFVREIYYFGLAYKIEAALGLVASSLVLFTQHNSGDLDTNANSIMPVVLNHMAGPASWLAVAVLTFGKLFEPLQEDWYKSESEFLAGEEACMLDGDTTYHNIPSIKEEPAPRRIMNVEEVRAMTQVVDNVAAEDDSAVYRSGIATLRSSAHRVKAKNRKQNPKPRSKSGVESKTTNLPASLCEEDLFGYDTSKYNLRHLFTKVLKKCNPNVVGTFRHSENDETLSLEHFALPTDTLHRKVNGGCCESAQAYMSDVVAADDDFLQAFDEMVEETILPRLKQRLIQAGAAKEDVPSSFYIQRPPTLRLQPGPGRAGVKPHNDGEYGHQNGELNFWLPLTDRRMTGVDLWCESSFQKSDYRPIAAQIGEVASFHGSSCRHFVNRNSSDKTRVSMDFRIGVEGFFDPFWQMNGTTDDHSRREVRL